jgi:hypothetical protein
MNINRHNYEEYFLLYADNELPADQRQAVEDFVQQNADLKEELNFLIELHLEPDTTLFFDNKESLLKPVILQDDAAPISEDEEKILRFIDFELNASETTELKHKLAKSPALTAELEVLSKTKLQPDLSVVFPDKSLLYKSTREKIHVLQMTWVRVAVAAAIILVAGLLWINNSVEETTGSGPLAVVPKTSIDENISSGTENNTDHRTDAASNEDPIVNPKVAQEQQQQIASSSIPNPIKEQNKIQADKRLAQEAKPTETQNQSPALIDNPNRHSENITTPGNEQPLVNVSSNLTRDNEIIDRPATNADVVKSNYATDALMSAQDAVEVVPVENNNNRKGPIRVIVRKANRLFNKVTNPDTDKPLLKVANFEIALAK